MYNLYDEGEESDGSRDKGEENDKTKEKMKLLRMKMANLTIAKKVRSLTHSGTRIHTILLHLAFSSYVLLTSLTHYFKLFGTIIITLTLLCLNRITYVKTIIWLWSFAYV